MAHNQNLTQPFSVASRGRLPHIGRVDNLHFNLDEHFLLASIFWSAVASGYWIYGWKQKSWIPLLGGAVMMAVSFFMPALTMSLACILTMVAVWWLLRQGY